MNPIWKPWNYSDWYANQFDSILAQRNNIKEKHNKGSERDCNEKRIHAWEYHTKIPNYKDRGNKTIKRLYSVLVFDSRHSASLNCQNPRDFSPILRLTPYIKSVTRPLSTIPKSTMCPFMTDNLRPEFILIFKQRSDRRKLANAWETLKIERSLVERRKLSWRSYWQCL